MGRRALRRPSTELNLAPFFRALEELPKPLDAAAHFGRAAPLEVELGSGKGLFLSSAATAQPERNFIGIEVAGKYARHAAGRLAKANCRHALMIHGDGLRFFREWLPDSTVAAVHVYFPDPWWKKRHQKRRVMQAPLVRDVQRVLQPGGLLHFWTDVQEYFEATLELLKIESSLEGPMEVPPRDPQHDLDYHTHFERRMRLHEKPVYRAQYRKAIGATSS